MHKFKKSILVAVALLSSSIWSAEVTKVLQNGSEGYTGCVDSYIKQKSDVANVGAWLYQNDNYKDSQTVESAWCMS